MNKHCSKCGQDKPVDEFSKDKKSKDGLCVHCKACRQAYRNSTKQHRAEYMREWRERNKEHIAEYDAANRDRVLAYRDATREHKQAQDREYYRRNRERILVHTAEYRDANRELINSRQRNAYRLHKTEVSHRRRERRKADIEKYRARAREYLRNNAEVREKARVRSREWREKNLDYVRRQQAAYREAHREELREYFRIHYLNNKSIYKERARARKIYLRGNTVARVSYKRIRDRDHDICHICGKRVAESEISFDHLIPVSHGGPHAEWNIAVSHLKCNLRRGPGRTSAQPYLPMEMTG